MAISMYNCNDTENFMRAYTYQDMYKNEETHFWFVGKQAFIRAALKKFRKKHAHILDIGCGTGGTTKILTHYGRVKAIEANQTAVRLAKSRGLRVIRHTANRLPFKKHTFDLITLFDVLYHKGVDEKQTLRQAYRVLKPGGLLLITDSAMPILTSHHDEIMDAKYRYTKKKLKKLIEEPGFIINTMTYIFTSLFPFFFISRFLTRHATNNDRLTTVSPVINRLLIGILQTEAACFPHIQLPFGSSLIAVSHKPNRRRSLP
jgi:ubiquinone/menaquinone biosynthesis C-methylase UbiE